MVTIFLPDTLIGNQQQGSLVGVYTQDRTNPDNAALIVTGIEYQLPHASHIGYLISSSQNDGLSGTAFSYLRSYAVLANDAVPQLICCAINGVRVPPSSVTLALYSPDDIRDAELLQAYLLDEPEQQEAAGSWQTQRAWDPLKLMLRCVCRDAGSTARPSSAAQKKRRRQNGTSPAVHPVNVGWLQWVVLEVCALVVFGQPKPALSREVPFIPVSRLQWLLIEAASALHLKTVPLVSLELRVTAVRYLRGLTALSAFLQQLQEKAALAIYIVMHAHRSIRWLNCLCIFVCDSAVGILFMMALLKWCDYDRLPNYVDNLLAESMSHMRTYVEWMMGEPAGLKLNVPLTSTLGGVYLYLLDLIAVGYSLAMPAVIFAVRLAAPFGFLGVSFLVCIVSDVVSFASTGVFLLYLLAAKLYRFEVVWLVRLWRLFRGRRWNPQKQREESWPYPLEHLFLGTLCFTILLFLLPTVLLYYAVLLWFRCVGVLVIFLLHVLLHLLNVNPSFVAAAWLAQYRHVAGSFHMKLLQDSSDCVVVRLDVVCSSLADTVMFFRCPLAGRLRPFSLRHFLRLVWQGETVHACDNPHLSISSAFAKPADPIPSTSRRL